jgi:hypothetical protein
MSRITAERVVAQVADFFLAGVAIDECVGKSVGIDA